MEYNSIMWLAVLIISGLVEAVTTGLFSIWFMVGAVFAFIGSLFNIPMIYQVLIFLTASLISMYYLRPVFKKHLQTKLQSTNADRVIGQNGIVVKDILQSVGQTGQVKVMGQIWTAVSGNGEDIVSGSNVTVEKISGVKLVVMPLMNIEHSKDEYSLTINK